MGLLAGIVQRFGTQGGDVVVNLQNFLCSVNNQQS